MIEIWQKINTPLTDEIIGSVKCGDCLLLSGNIFVARDKAHERIKAMKDRGEKLPFDLKNQIIYYMGPSPAPSGKIIGSAGPTTSGRMDPFTETMLALGVTGMIGKGKRDKNTRDLLQQYHAIYFSTFGGAGAYLNKKIVESTLIAFEDLGAEAVYYLYIVEFPIIVVNDIFGGDLYEAALRK